MVWCHSRMLGNVALGALLVFSGGPAPAQLTEDAGERMLRQVKLLSSPKLLGRGAGTDFARRAAEYVAEELEAANVAPLPGGLRFQAIAPGDPQGSPDHNVLGWIARPSAHGPELLPGDGSLEVIVLGAHLDHLGVAPQGGFFPGADDNASGVAVVLEVARALARRAETLRRPVVVVLFGAEEVGLRGSFQFVRSGIVPLEHIVGMVNVDMIGRPFLDQSQLKPLKRTFQLDDERGLGVVGVAGRPRLARLVTKQATDVSLYGTQPWLAPIVAQLSRNRSDHAPFERVGIPSVFLSSGPSDDYHQVTDTADKISEARLVRRAEFVWRLVRELATVDASELAPVENAQLPPGMVPHKQATLAHDIWKVNLGATDQRPPRWGVKRLGHGTDPAWTGPFGLLRLGADTRQRQPARRRLFAVGPKAAFVLRREQSPFDVSSTVTYHVPHTGTIDFRVDCAAHDPQRLGANGSGWLDFAGSFPRDQIQNCSYWARGRADGESSWRQIALGDPDVPQLIDPRVEHAATLNDSHDPFVDRMLVVATKHQMVWQLMWSATTLPADSVHILVDDEENDAVHLGVRFALRQGKRHQRRGFHGRLLWQPWDNWQARRTAYAQWLEELEQQVP